MVLQWPQLALDHNSSHLQFRFLFTELSITELLNLLNGSKNATKVGWIQ